MKNFSVLPPYPMMRADFVVLTLLSKDEDIPKHQRERLKRLVERFEYTETKLYPFYSTTNKDKYPV